MLRGLFRPVGEAFKGHEALDDELLDDLQEQLVLADVSVETAGRLCDGLRQASRRRRLTSDEGRKLLQEQIAALIARNGEPMRGGPTPPTVYLIVGVNGTGKTTTIAKIAHFWRSAGRKVLMAAADTFRAAAIEQLEAWASRTGADLVKHQAGSDPAAVVHDALQAAKARGSDLVIIDTAGRLHTKHNLMEELRKVRRVVEREMGRPPDETLLVIDATTGQNAVVQARQFKDALEITGLVLAKADGTAKGGTIITIAEQLGIPIKMLGTGEQLGDIEAFDAQRFVANLFEG
jgi:fused signal recognition particle receptor